MSKRDEKEHTLQVVWETASIGVVGYLAFRTERVEGPWPSPTSFWSSVATLLKAYPVITDVQLFGVHGHSQLSADTIKLLRTDTVDAVRELVGPPVQQLRIGGYITLQQSFGTHVCLVRSGNAVVCPFCVSKVPAYGTLFHCQVELPVSYLGPLARVAVADLLVSGKDSFYFPWVWNPTSPRIGRDDLQKLATRWQEINHG